MILNGWKEIAKYLHSSVRSVQRWAHLGLPVIRTSKIRGPVISHSEKLDSWLNNRGFGHVRSDVAASIARARSLQGSVANELQVSLKAELGVGMTHARIALQSRNAEAVSRYTAIARKAYDTIIRLNQRIARTAIHSEEFTAEFERLKDALQRLGEKI